VAPRFEQARQQDARNNDLQHGNSCRNHVTCVGKWLAINRAD
jgi:hypothetical protein